MLQAAVIRLALFGEGVQLGVIAAMLEAMFVGDGDQTRHMAAIILARTGQVKADAVDAIPQNAQILYARQPLAHRTQEGFAVALPVAQTQRAAEIAHHDLFRQGGADQARHLDGDIADDEGAAVAAVLAWLVIEEMAADAQAQPQAGHGRSVGGGAAQGREQDLENRHRTEEVDIGAQA